MTALYEDPPFTLRFADDRLIPRFHLEGVEADGRSPCSRSTLPQASGSACWRPGSLVKASAGT
jgi:hypothetical protein